MTDIVTTPPFWLDHEYDRDNADSRSTSRYGNYLYQSRHQFAEIDDDDPSVEFAALARRIGTGPIMSPPFIRKHQRVLGATIGRSSWNGEMTIDIDLISNRPPALRNAKTADGAYYRDWTTDYHGDFQGIGEDDLVRNAYLISQTRILLQLPPGTVPTIAEVPTSSGQLLDQAIESLDALVRAINREVRPVIDQLES